MFFGTNALMAGLSEASRIMTELITEKDNLIRKTKQQELVISEQKKRIEELQARNEMWDSMNEQQAKVNHELEERNKRLGRELGELRFALNKAEINNCKLGFKVLTTNSAARMDQNVLKDVTEPHLSEPEAACSDPRHEQDHPGAGEGDR